MNRVNADTPLSEIIFLLQKDGYVLMENALTPEQVALMSAAYDRQLALHPPKPGASRVEVPRFLERDSVFEDLMDLSTVFPIARTLIGADIELASGGELDHKFAHTPAYIGWHDDFVGMTNVPYPRQNFWVRCTYFLSDVTPESGPFTLLPGTHLATHGCPPDLKNEAGQPLTLPDQVGIVGPAGSCLIDNTEIWHTNTPNTGDLPRRLLMLLYKHAWMKPWQGGFEITAEFAAKQTDPIRQQLVRQVIWHQGAERFPAFTSTITTAAEEKPVPLS